jgi:NAD(P)-dependent dehydrogenase (short-subunit alcohol dehydrogenase family)
VHNPDAFCLVGIGRATWQDPLELADPARSQANIIGIVERGEARYCASKLLNLMHVRHLARELPVIGVVAFNPSVVPGTDIGRAIATGCSSWAGSISCLCWRRSFPERAGWASQRAICFGFADADAVCLSGQYVNGRVPRRGSGESRDPAKIMRAVEVAREIIGRAVDTARPLAANRA